MKKIICVIFFSISVIFAHAQEESKQFIHKGILRAMGTISPGILLKENFSTISLYGTLEGYVSDNISIRGDSYYDILSASKKNNDRPFEFNHATFSGASYHFKTKNHFDPYIAIEPGISISERKDVSDLNIWCDPAACPDYYSVHPKTEVNPLISSALGFNYYFQRWFHLFIEARYVSGRHIPTDGSPTLSLNELKFAFGLGLNINALKKK